MYQIADVAYYRAYNARGIVINCYTLEPRLFVTSDDARQYAQLSRFGTVEIEKIQ